jgi:DNA mismatch repair protein MutS2
VDSFTLSKIEFDAVRRILSQLCACSPGRQLALRIGPSRSPDVIQRWQRQVSQMLYALRDHGLPPFGGLTDISGALERAMPSGGASAEDFAAIAAALDAAGAVKNHLVALPEQFDELIPLAEPIGDFASEIEAIRRIVGDDGEVRDEASPRLASIRREIESTSRRIHEVIYGYLRQSDVVKLLQNVTVTMHGDRYVLPVKMENRGRLPGVVHRASASGATVFVEPNASVELNNHLADLRDDERMEIQRLLNQLAVRIGGRGDDIRATMRELAQIDLLSAKAQYSYRFDMVAPEVHEHGPLELRQARHPLLVDQQWRLEKQGAEPDQQHPVVPIDIRLGEDFDLLVVTGSNTGGKTVALKTLALLVVMAQSGMHIPAGRSSRLPVFRDVFIDIGDEQSLEQSLSTFGAHVKRINYILRKLDRNSLVLLDELGSGTDPDEGGAIGQAVLDHLRSIGCVGMITTHLSVLKAYAVNHERVDNASVEFDTATMKPTYRLLIGTPGESHAIAVAKRLGLPKAVVHSARQHLSGQHKQFRRAIRATGAARQQAETARSEAQAARVAADIQTEALQSRMGDLQKLQEEFNTWLARLPEMKSGDEIYVPSLNKTGTLGRLELHRQRALVNVGSMQVEVPLSDLMPDLGQKQVRDQLANLRRQILEQARAAEADRAEAQRLHDEFARSLAHQKQRARQFDQWLASIARVKVGDEVPIARKPGRGKVLAVDLPGLKAKVATSAGEMDLSIQDLFPQTGPFAPHAEASRPKRSARKGRGKAEQEQADKDRPLPRRSPKSKAAKRSHEQLLAAQPGEAVYVIPFRKRATLVRLRPDKGAAVVQSGAFEMELPLADIEPVGDK